MQLFRQKRIRLTSSSTEAWMGVTTGGGTEGKVGICSLIGAFHLLEQCLGVLSHRNESISHVIGVDTINKAVILNNDQLKKRKDTSPALIYNTAPFSTLEFLMKACLIPTSVTLSRLGRMSLRNWVGN